MPIGFRLLQRVNFNNGEAGGVVHAARPQAHPIHKLRTGSRYAIWRRPSLINENAVKLPVPNAARELVQGGRTRDEKLANTPTIFELMDKYKTPEAGRRLATALLASGEFHRPYLAPPQIRPELVRTIREAFNKTMKDPEFLAETKRKKLDMDPTTGEEVEALTKDVMSQPPEVIERLKKMMKN